VAIRNWQITISGQGTSGTASNTNDIEAIIASVTAALLGANNGVTATNGYTNNGIATGASPAHKIFSARFWADGILERDYVNPLQTAMPL
jgi:hypothetical protein